MDWYEVKGAEINHSVYNPRTQVYHFVEATEPIEVVPFDEIHDRPDGRFLIVVKDGVPYADRQVMEFADLHFNEGRWFVIGGKDYVNVITPILVDGEQRTAASQVYKCARTRERERVLRAWFWQFNARPRQDDPYARTVDAAKAKLAQMLGSSELRVHLASPDGEWTGPLEQFLDDNAAGQFSQVETAAMRAMEVGDTLIFPMATGDSFTLQRVR
jgi:hypothetical protein